MSSGDVVIEVGARLVSWSAIAVFMLGVLANSWHLVLLSFGGAIAGIVGCAVLAALAEGIEKIVGHFQRLLVKWKHEH